MTADPTTTVFAFGAVAVFIVGVAATTLMAIRIGDRRWARRVRRMADNDRRHRQ